MGIPTTRREMRRRRKAHERGVRSLRATIALGIIGVLTMGGTTMAMAAEAPVDDQNTAVTVEVTSTGDASGETDATTDETNSPTEQVAEEVVSTAETPAQPEVADSNATAKTTQPQGGYEQPFDWNWQYAAPTCDGLTVVYPKNIPAGSDNKDVNIRVKNLTTGETQTFNFHDSNFNTSGKTVTYQVTQHPNWPGWTYYEVQWTQVHGTNYHWEGSVICGTSPPPPCVQKPSWSYTFDGIGSGTITVTAKDAKQGDKLCDALAVRATTFEYVRPASGNPSWPQTLIGYNDVLVDTIGTFSYAAPALDSCRQHDVYAEFVSKGGFDALKVPSKLNGPNNPYEPQFLHQALPGKGPNPTYSTTSSDGCNTPPSTPEPKVEYTNWQDSEWVCGDTEVTQTRTKTTTPYKVVVQDGKYVTVVDTANIKVVTETQTRPLTDAEIESCKPEIPEPKVTYTEWQDEAWVCGDTETTQNRTKTTTPYQVVLVSGSTWKVVEDTENVTTTVETQTRALTEEEVESCKPETPEPKVTYTEWQDEEWVCGDTEVTQMRTKTTTPYKVVLVEGSTWQVIEDTVNIKTVTENQTRPLTKEEIESCEVPPTTPPTTPPGVKTPPPSAHTGDLLSGSSPLGSLALGFGVVSLIAVAAFLARRRSAEQ